MISLLIRGGRVIDPANSLDGPRDVLLQDGTIAAIELPGILREADQLIDAGGCIVAPALIDMHVHLREPGQTWKETIATGTQAAAAGGFGSIVAMPNTVPVNDSLETMAWMLSPGRFPAVRLFAMPAATVGSMGAELTDYEALARAGALGFTDDGKPVLDDAVMRAALLRAGRLGLPISQHAEDTRVSPSSGINAGPIAFKLGLRGMSAEAESSIVERDIALVRHIQQMDGVRARLHVQHVSTAAAIQAIRRAKQDGLAITCEVTPHHFTLTEDAIGDFNTEAKMNPPLRSEADRRAVITALIDGTVDCIATDHAPHARHEKEVEFERAPNGITGLETALGLALRVLHGVHGMSYLRILELMSAAPARVLGLSNAGTLRIGAWGDILVFDPNVEWRFHSANSKSRSKNTPFDGATMRGRVETTIVAGQVVFRG